MGILVALALLAGMSVATLGAARNVLREFSICGSQLLGARAFLAADSGLEWGLAQLGQGGPAGAAARLVSPLQAPFPQASVTLVPEPAALPGGPGQAPAGFSLEARYLGRVERSFVWPGARAGPAEPADPPRPLDDLWAVTAHGHCQVGGPGPGRQTYQQTCRAILATLATPGPGADPDSGGPAPEKNPAARLLAWEVIR